MKLPQLPSITEQQIQSIIDGLDMMTWMEQGTFTSPENMKAMLEHGMAVYAPNDISLKGYLEELWTRVEGNFITTGKAVSWIAMQEAMIDELKKERDAMIGIGYESCEAELMGEAQSQVMDALIACGCDEEAVEIFVQTLYGGEFDPHAQKLIRKLVTHVYAVEMEKLEYVE